MKQSKINFFVKSVYKYQNALGLTDYEIHVLPYNKPGVKSSCVVNIEGKICSIFYNKKWIKKVSFEEMQKVAFHEINELNLIELNKMLKRYYSEEEIHKQIHSVIRRAENTYYKLLD